MKPKRIVALVFLLLSLPLISQQKTKTIKPLNIENKIITIDGKLDEEEWQQAPVAGQFIQFEPRLGEPASFETKARVLYDDHFLYVGISCYDPEPDKIVSRVTKREGALETDDTIAIGLDTFADQRTAYGFFTNILGTQLDGRLSDNGRTWDPTWDGEWKSAGNRTDFGWTVEVAIPFTSLKFNPGTDKTWGFGLVRFIPRQLEIDTWTGPVENYRRVSQFGILTGLNLKKSKKKYRIIPHLISKFEEGKNTEIDVGLDARYAFSQTVSANLTVNPDFAIIEADEEVINLTRFEAYLPEKRNFFLEGSEIYKQRIQLFYSRRIEDIYGGLKVYGKLGKYEFSSLIAQSKPGNDPDDLSASFTVFRLRRDIFKSSNIGFLVANKHIGGLSQGSLGLDVVHFFS
ncbi:MAG: carbohydrate binding family 9 domain-containing protein, partial [Candidatus Aminicenantes bacterium]|nr:carbohydrate binding family 9 domain-containing protein [Candidatus Aminicenantes bacterium]